MRKIRFIFFALFIFSVCHTSVLKAQIGVRAGINFSTMTGHNVGNSSLNVNLLAGFHAGLSYDLPLSEYFLIQPGFLFSTKGYTEKGIPGSDNYTFKKTGYYAEIPINFIYRPSLGTGHLLLGAGPYLACGVGGRWTNESTENTKGKIVFVEDFKDYDNAYARNLVYGKRADYGINALIGYEFSSKLFAQLNGQYGLKDITPLKDNENLDVQQYNIQFGVSVGYKF